MEQPSENERTNARREGAAAAAAVMPAAALTAPSVRVRSVVRVGHRSPIGHLRRECFISAPTAAAFRGLERDR